MLSLFMSAGIIPANHAVHLHTLFYAAMQRSDLSCVRFFFCLRKGKTEQMTNELQANLTISYEEAIPLVTAALKEVGFGVLTEIDVKETLKTKIDADFRKYVILGACNPNLAYQALSADLDMGLLLPCNVIVYEEDDGSVVSIIDPLQMLSVAERPELADVAQEAREKLERVAAALRE